MTKQEIVTQIQRAVERVFFTSDLGVDILKDLKFSAADFTEAFGIYDDEDAIYDAEETIYCFEQFLMYLCDMRN